MALDIKDSYCEMTMSKYIEDLVKDNGEFDQRIHHSLMTLSSEILISESGVSLKL